MSDSEPCSENLSSSVDGVDSVPSLPSLMSLSLPDLPIPSLVARCEGEGSHVRLVLAAPTPADAPFERVRSAELMRRVFPGNG